MRARNPASRRISRKTITTQSLEPTRDGVVREYSVTQTTTAAPSKSRKGPSIIDGNIVTRQFTPDGRLIQTETPLGGSLGALVPDGQGGFKQVGGMQPKVTEISLIGSGPAIPVTPVTPDPRGYALPPGGFTGKQPPAFSDGGEQALPVKGDQYTGPGFRP